MQAAGTVQGRFGLHPLRVFLTVFLENLSTFEAILVTSPLVLFPRNEKRADFSGCERKAAVSKAVAPRAAMQPRASCASAQVAGVPGMACVQKQNDVKQTCNQRCEQGKVFGETPN